MSSPDFNRRITPTNLLITAGLVVVVQVLAIGITYQNIPVYPSLGGTTGNYSGLVGVPGNTAAGSAIDSFVLVAIAFGATLALVWLLRRRMVLSFKALIFGALALAAFVLTLSTADTIALDYFPAQLEIPIAFGAAAAVVIVIGYTIFVRTNKWLSTSVLAFVGAEVGSFFAGTLSKPPSFPLTALLLPVAFSIYDIYAVFRGPLRQLVGISPNIALNGMSVRLGEFTLGLGDIVFYTMLPSLAMFYVSYSSTLLQGFYASLATILAIDAGVVVTLYLLSKRKMLPGLPIPMLLGVVVTTAILL